jgi:hypothetical protein
MPKCIQHNIYFIVIITLLHGLNFELFLLILKQDGLLTYDIR